MNKQYFAANNNWARQTFKPEQNPTYSSDCPRPYIAQDLERGPSADGYGPNREISRQPLVPRPSKSRPWKSEAHH